MVIYLLWWVFDKYDSLTNLFFLSAGWSWSFYICLLLDSTHILYSRWFFGKQDGLILEFRWVIISQLLFSLSSPTSSGTYMFIHLCCGGKERIHLYSDLLLFFRCWWYRLTRAGSVILALHDASDVFLEIGKMSKYCGAETLASISFVLFALSWVVLRLIYYPFWILWSTRFVNISPKRFTWMFL